MKTKFTPGPWKVEKYEGALEVWSQNTFICSTDSNLFRTAHSQFQDAPNAALIAAAPEMFEALNKALKTLRSIEWSHNVFMPETTVEIEAILKKARGE